MIFYPMVLLLNALFIGSGAMGENKSFGRAR
jgi:hypothetical protein